MVFYTSLDGLDPLFFESRLNLLPEEKQKWVEKTGNERAKRETTLAWLLLRYALKMGSSDSFLPLTFSERGKPCFEGGDVFFNLSHSGSMVCAAVSGKYETGVDVQKKSIFSERVKRRVFCESEIERGERENDSDSYFTRLWAIKESYLKQTGVGIAFELKTLDYSAECMENYFEKDDLCYSVRQSGNYFFCVCTPEKGEQEFRNIPAVSII